MVSFKKHIWYGYTISLFPTYHNCISVFSTKSQKFPDANFETFRIYIFQPYINSVSWLRTAAVICGNKHVRLRGKALEDKNTWSNEPMDNEMNIDWLKFDPSIGVTHQKTLRNHRKHNVVPVKKCCSFKQHCCTFCVRRKKTHFLSRDCIEIARDNRWNDLGKSICQLCRGEWHHHQLTKEKRARAWDRDRSNRLRNILLLDVKLTNFMV